MINCHASGDAGYAAADKIHQQFGGLEQSIARSHEILTRAGESGMEVSQANLDLTAARDQLTKARVTLHTFKPAKVEEDVKAGTEITAKTYQAGVQALKERDYRRMGLGVSLITILAMLIGLRLYITQIERK